jgi:diadenosine tetraphosphate (Ap4A) HIT family hydrolase
MRDGCPFCSFDPSRVIFRDEHVFACWDSFAVSDGHVLIVTHRHIADWFGASEAEQRALLVGIAKGREIILNKYAPAGFNIGVNVGEAAGQTVPHLHVHLIPRYPGDVADPRGGVPAISTLVLE